MLLVRFYEYVDQLIELNYNARDSKNSNIFEALLKCQDSHFEISRMQCKMFNTIEIYF